jgi:tripartite-type tricarboxylate transporter receptor subunit TctC
VPLVMDLTKDKESLQILNLMFARQGLGRPYVAPPGVPAKRAKALQDAFMKTMSDPEFLAEAKKGGVNLSPISGERVAELVAAAYKTPKAVIARTIDAIR